MEEAKIEPERESHQPRKHALKGLISKQRRLKIIEAALCGEDPKKVAIEMGLSPRTADCQTSRIINSPAVKASIVKIYEESGLTGDFLAAKAKALIDAKTTIFAQKDGVYTDSRELPALETQRKTLEMVHRLRGDLKDSSAGGDVNIGLMQMVVQAVRSPDDT